MSLLKKQNKFEESIKAKLSELETKPSDSLWAKMEKELDTDSFEPALRQKFDDFTIPVSENTWNSIEAQLPQEKNRKRILLVWFAGIFISALSLGILISRFYLPSQSSSNELSLQTDKKQIQSKSPLNNQIEAEANTTTQDQASVNGNSSLTPEISNVEVESNSGNTASVLKSNNELDSDVHHNVTEQKTKSSFNRPASNVVAKNSDLGSKYLNPEETQINKTEIGAINQPNTTKTPIGQEPPLHPQANSLSNQDANSSPKVTEGRLLTEAKAPVQLEDVHIKFDKDSIVRGQEVNAENYTAEEDKPGKFSITALVGVYRTEMLLTKPSNSVYDLDKAFDLRTKLERASVDWSGGFLLNYHIRPKWMISSGVQISNFKQALHYDLADPVSDTFNQLQSQNLYLHPSDSIIEGHVKTLVNKFSFTEIPIWVTYSIQTNGSIGFDLMLGYSFAFLTSVNAYMPDPACVGLLNVNDKNSFPFLKGSSFINIAPAVNYKINQTVQLGVMPQFKLGLSSVIDNKNWIQEKPMAVGLNFYLRKRF